MTIEDQDFVILNTSDIDDSDEDVHLPVSQDKYAEIQAWLAPTDYSAASSEYGKHIASHLPGTGTWIFQTEQYRQWQDSHSERGALWVKAIAGAGKSVIAASIISKLASQEHVPVLYFFFRHIISANQTPYALVRDYLSQILHHSPKLQHKLYKMVEKHTPLDNMSLDQTWKILVSTLKQLPKAYCVVDALDEMDSGNEFFLQKLLALAAERPNTIKVLMTSRPVPRVEQVLKDPAVLQIFLQPRFVDPDIFVYVRHRVNQFDVSEVLRSKVHETMCAKADGHFLYARLMMDDLFEISKHSLSREEELYLALDRLPVPMNDMYTRMLADHSRRSGVSRELQIALLQWVTRSERPLRLIELAAVVSFENSARGVSREMKSVVREGCGPLLEILEDETVCPIHHSFTEYLYDQERSLPSSNATSFPVLDYNRAQHALANVCIRYLSSGWHHDWTEQVLQKTRRANLRNNSGAMKLKYPFLDYAANNWHRHLVKSEDLGASLTPNLDSMLLRDPNVLPALIEFTLSRKSYVHNRQSPVTQDPLHFAAAKGLTFFTEYLIQKGHDIESESIGKRRPMHFAAHEGHDEVVALLIKNKAQPNHANDHGLTPIHIASSVGHFGVVKILLESGVDPWTPKTKENPGRRCGNAPKTRGQTAVLYACKGGHFETVKTFLPYLQPDRVNQALHWALQHDQTKVATVLLESGRCDVNSEIQGQTPLFLACSTHNVEMMRTLLIAGANAHALAQDYDNDCLPRRSPRRQQGSSALHAFATAMNGEAARMMEGVELLLKAGISPNIIARDGSTILHIIVNTRARTASSVQSTKMDVELVLAPLFERGLSATAVTANGSNALHLAVGVSTAAINLPISQGVDLNQIRKTDRKTPLMAALSSNDYGLASYLLSCGANPIITDINGDSPLHLIAQSYFFQPVRHLDLVKTLIDAGVNVNARNKQGNTALHSKKPDQKLLDLFIERGFNLENKNRSGCTLLLQSVSPWGDFEMMKKLLEAGANIRTRDSHGSTVLHAAIAYMSNHTHGGTNLNMLKFFVEKGMDPLATDDFGNTLWHVFVKHRSNWFTEETKAVVNQLSEFGLSHTVPNNAGQTPLHFALALKANGYTDCMVEYLLTQANADINAPDCDDIRPLHLTASHNLDFTHRLLALNADPLAPTLEGQTPLMVACRNRQADIVCMLLDHYKNNGLLHAINYVDHSGRSALHFACKSGRPEVVAMLLEAGANVNLKDNRKLTPLHWCAEFLNEQSEWERAQASVPSHTPAQTIYPLLSGSARPNLQSMSTDPLRVREAVQLLVAHGADTASLMTLGNTGSPLFYAIQRGCEPVVSELLIIQDKLLQDKLSTAETSTTDEIARKQIQDEVNTIKETVTKTLNTWTNKIKFLKMRRMPEIIAEMVGSDVSRRMLITEILKNDDEPGFEQLSELGFNFLEQLDSSGNNVLSQLCSWGFTMLMRRFGRDASLMSVKWAKNLITLNDLRYGQPKSILQVALARTIPNLEMVKLLVCELGLDTKEMFSDGARDPKSHSLLHLLATPFHWWQAKALEFLLERGDDVDTLDSNEETPLIVGLRALRDANYNRAARVKAIEVLLSYGANANSTDMQGQTCLNIAAKQPECVALLLKHGANASLGIKPFIFDVIETQNLDLLRLILKSGADVNTLAQTKLTAPKPRKRIRSSSDVDVARSLSDVQYLNELSNFVYPVHVAASHFFQGQEKRSKALAAIQMLIDAGANPFLTCKDGSSVMHYLAETGGTIQPFFDHASFDIESRDGKGRTILLAACDHRPKSSPDPTTLMLPLQLLQHGASPTATDHEGRNALHCLLTAAPISSSHDNPYSGPVLRSFIPLLSGTADLRGQTPLHYALSRSQFQLIDALIDHGADPLVPDPVTGQTALHYLAPGLGKLEEQVLMPLRISDGFSGLTGPRSLELAPSRSVQHQMKVLLARGLSINDRDHKGETPVFKLMTVHPRGRLLGDEADGSLLLHAFEFFQDHGANFTLRSNSGESVLHRLATQTGRDQYSMDELREYTDKRLQKCFSWLMERGVDITWEDENARTCLDVAAAMGSQWVLDMFKREQ